MLAVIDVVASLLLKFAQAAPTIIQTVNGVKPFATQLIGTISGKSEITEAEAEALHALVDAALDEAQQPLPPAQPGDPDFKG